MTAETAEAVSWTKLTFSDRRPGSGLAPFVVWKVEQDGVIAAGESPAQARARLAVKLAARQD